MEGKLFVLKVILADIDVISIAGAEMERLCLRNPGRSLPAAFSLFGVAADEARAERPAYRPGDAVNVELGLGMTAEWGGAWRVIANGSVEFLANELRESPLVERGWVSHAFVAVNYTF